MRKLGSRVGSALPFLAGSARPPASPQQRGTVHAAAPAADAPERPPPAEARRLTLLLVGPAGKGKSTLGNLLVLGRAPDGSPGELPFDTSEEFDSVGVDIAHADFEFGGVPCRVIDAPGTDGGACDVAEKLAKCAEGEKPLAPGGVDVFVFVMQKGRFTEDLAGQLLALEDAAGPDSRARTVVVFTHCGTETTPELLQRLVRSRVAQDMVKQYPAVVGVDSLEPTRAEEDRAALMGAVTSASRKAQAEPRPVAAVDVKRALQEMDGLLADLSEERQDAMRAKLHGVRSGCVSLSAARQALEEARQQQLLDEHRRIDQDVLRAEAFTAQDEASRIKAATTSMLEKVKISEERRVMACCTPASACKDVCTPCEEGAKELMEPCNDGANDVIRGWREERRRALEAKFGEADAIADLAALACPRHRESPMRLQRPTMVR